MPRNKIVRTIPDKLFYHLWKAAESGVELEEYIHIFVSHSSDNRIQFYRKYKINENQAVVILKNIYAMANMKLNDIVTMSGKKKSEIGYMFCIPIRTLEDWCSGKNRCPAYARLMMIRRFGLLNLGKYIYLESDNHIVYNKYKGKGKSTKDRAVVLPENEELIDPDDYCASDKNDYMMSLKEYEQLHVHNSYSDIQNIIAATDYLRDYMKKT